MEKESCATAALSPSREILLYRFQDTRAFYLSQLIGSSTPNIILNAVKFEI
jgi:hypothetical protein